MNIFGWDSYKFYLQYILSIFSIKFNYWYLPINTSNDFGLS